jgi:hypothetical protein
MPSWQGSNYDSRVDADSVERSSGTISGTVTGTAGVALPGATIHVFTAATSTWVAVTTAGAGGAYSLTLAPGTYKLFVQPNTAGYSNTWYGGVDYASATLVDLTTASATVNIALP